MANAKKTPVTVPVPAPVPVPVAAPVAAPVPVPVPVPVAAPAAVGVPVEMERFLRRREGFNYLVVEVDWPANKKRPLGIVLSTRANQVIVVDLKVNSIGMDKFQILDHVVAIDSFPISEHRVAKQLILRNQGKFTALVERPVTRAARAELSASGAVFKPTPVPKPVTTAAKLVPPLPPVPIPAAATGSPSVPAPLAAPIPAAPAPIAAPPTPAASASTEEKGAAGTSTFLPPPPSAAPAKEEEKKGGEGGSDQQAPASPEAPPAPVGETIAISKPKPAKMTFPADVLSMMERHLAERTSEAAKARPPPKGILKVKRSLAPSPRSLTSPSQLSQHDIAASQMSQVPPTKTPNSIDLRLQSTEFLIPCEIKEGATIRPLPDSGNPTPIPGQDPSQPQSQPR